MSEDPPPTIIISGLTDEQTFRLIDEYKKIPGLPASIFASVTPHSLEWKLKDLLKKLEKEHQFHKNKKSGGK